MSNLVPVLIMTPIQAANLADQTRGREYYLQPILIRGGVHAGKYCVNANVKYNENYADALDALTLLPEVAIDPNVAFPPEEEVIE